MDKGVRDYTLMERTISRLVGGQELLIAQCGGSQPVSRPLKAPSLDHLDFGGSGAEPTNQESIPQRRGIVKAEDPPRPVEDGGSEDVPGRGRKAAIIIRFLLLTTLLIVVNEFYGRPLRGSRWLKLETYRTTIGNIAGSKPPVTRDHIQQPRKIDIKGIAYSNNKPSAIIGGRVVHVGDVVSDAMITKIGPKGVAFQADGRTWTQKVQ